MNIQITPKKTEGVERLLQVEVPVADVREAEASAARRYATRVRVPGFRPGKAPADMVRKRFGEAIRQEVVESLVQEAYKQAVADGNLRLASQPHVHDLKFEDGKPLTFELHFEVRPEIELPRTRGFRVSRTLRAVTDDNVREQIEQLRDQRASWVPVTEPAREGDLVTVHLSTGDEAGEMPEGKEYNLVIGAGQAIPGIEELIMSARPGETGERPVKWPDDFPDVTQRSAVKRVRVTVRDVKRKSLPEVDDAFAREVGDFESADALRQAVREDLEREAQRESDADLRQKLMDEIVGANPFEIPPSWVTQLVAAYADAWKIPDDERERFAGQFRPMAERQVRRDLVIETLSEREQLAASEADIDTKVTEMAARGRSDPGQLYTSLQKSGRLRELERGITEDKVFAWLFEQNTVE